MKTKPQVYHSKVGPSEPLTKEAALALLADSDHGLIAENFARAVTEAFGVPEFLIRYEVNPSEFKGLQAWDDDGNELPEGTYIFGAAAHDLAEHLCRSLNVSFLPMLGRGSRLRSCVTALRTWLDFGQPKL